MTIIDVVSVVFLFDLGLSWMIQNFHRDCRHHRHCYRLERRLQEVQQQEDKQEDPHVEPDGIDEEKFQTQPHLEISDQVKTQMGVTSEMETVLQQQALAKWKLKLADRLATQEERPQPSSQADPHLRLGGRDPNPPFGEGTKRVRHLPPERDPQLGAPSPGQVAPLASCTAKWSASHQPA